MLTPETEHAPFDLVIWKDGKFKTVQVKYRTISNGNLCVKFSSVWYNSKGAQTKQANKSLIDIYCIYCPNNDTCYYLNPKQFKGSAKIKIKKLLKKKDPKCHFDENYLEVPWEDGQKV